MTSNELTKKAIMILRASGFDVWRQNNHATKGRKFIGRKGVPDILGFHKKTGLFTGVEIKVGSDKMSEHQELMKENVTSAGALYYVCRDEDSLIDWIQTLNR